jgi:hypothetical protein
LGLFFVKYQKKKELNGKFSILNSQFSIILCTFAVTFERMYSYIFLIKVLEKAWN